MNLFDEKEVKEIKELLKNYIKENQKITDSYDMTRIIDDNTDFEGYKYDGIERILKYYIKYEGSINNNNLKNIILDIEELEGNNNVFTQTNIIVSVITAVIAFFIAVGIDNVVILIGIVFSLIWAYLSRYIGLKKGIDNGYVWGYFLGLIGFVVICVLRGEKDNTQQIISTSNKYEDLERLQKLKDAGTITEQEFNREKQKLLR